MDLFNYQTVSADLILIEINNFDLNNFAADFNLWVSEQNKNDQFNTDNKRLTVLFKINPVNQLSSTDLALILELARQNSLVPIGFINTSNLVVEYAQFANLALFEIDAINLHNQTKKDSFKLDKSPSNLPQDLTILESFYHQPPDFLQKDISGDLICSVPTFIQGNVFINAQIKADKSIYIYGSCYGSVILNNENERIFIQKLRARKIKIGAYFLEPAQYESNWIDKAVVFSLQNKKIQTQVISS